MTANRIQGASATATFSRNSPRPTISITPIQGDTVSGDRTALQINFDHAVSRSGFPEVPFAKFLNQRDITTNNFYAFRRALTKMIPNHAVYHYGYVEDGQWTHYGLIDTTVQDRPVCCYVISLNTTSRKHYFQTFNKDIRFGLDQRGKNKGKLVKVTINKTAKLYRNKGTNSETIQALTELIEARKEVIEVRNELNDTQSKLIKTLNDLIEARRELIEIRARDLLPK